MRLVISLATRGRPQQVVETITRSTANLVLPDTLLMVQIDADDAATIAALGQASLDARVKVDVRPREDTIAGKWNRAMGEPADLYLVAADDAPDMTPGYDAKLLEAAARFPDGIGVVYGHLANLSFPGVMAPTAKFVEKLGYIFPELFPYWFVDHWIDDVARLIGRISFADVRTDQSRAGKTQEMREPAWWATFFDAAYRKRRSIAHAILDDPDFVSPRWQRDILRHHHPLIEVRSRMINEGVRAQARQLEAWSMLTAKDERYQRVRAAAVAMLPHLLDDYGMDPAEAAAYRATLTPPDTIVNLKRAFA